MSAPKRAPRPLSPFMIGPYYRPQITSISSILIRITGLGLIASVALTIWWIFAAATSGAEPSSHFNLVNAIVGSWFGVLVYTLSAWAVWYHLLGGVRHFLFDTGRGLEIETAQKLGWGMVYGSVILTVLTVLIIAIF